MSVKVFGVEIQLQDNASLLTPDTAIGLYNRTSNLSGNAASGQKDVAVVAGSTFRAGDKVTIRDGSASEVNVIASISTNTLTMVTNLANTYTTAASARVDANSVFRWIQNAAAGVTGWVAGMILEDGLSPYSRGADYREGGGLSFPGSCGVSLKNTSLFWDDLADLGISLNSMEFRLYEFVDAVATLKWRGYVEQPKFDSTKYDITAQGGERNRRNTALAKETNSDEYPGTEEVVTVPATLGKFLFENKSLANIIRISKSENYWANNDLTSAIEIIGESRYIGLTAFKVNADYGSINYIQLKICDAYSMVSYALLNSTLTGKYIKVIYGTGQGQIRKIASIAQDVEGSYTNPSIGCIGIYVTDFFEDILDTTSWVKIVTVENDNAVDSWPCYSFLDSQGGLLSKNCFPYMINDAGKYNPFSQYLFPITQDSNNNKIAYDYKQITDTFDGSDDFIIFPIVSPSYVFEASEFDSVNPYWHKIANGHFIYSSDMVNNINESHEDTNSIENVVDKIYSSYFEMFDQYVVGGIVSTVSITNAISFKLPDISGIDFDDAYLMIRFRFDTHSIAGPDYDPQPFYTGMVHNIYLYINKYYGPGSPDVTISKSLLKTTPPTYFGITDFNNVRDDYLDPSIDEKNYYFFRETDTRDEAPSGVTNDITGYIKIPMELVSNSDLASMIENCILRFDTVFPGVGTVGLVARVTIDLKIYEAAIVLKKSVDIPEKFYTPYFGRIYNDTWAVRKTAASPMENPVDFLEHSARLQNWSENSPPPSAGWGYGYAAGALVKTTGTGSFDAADLQGLKTLSLCEQIQDYDRSYTDKVKDAICKAFFMGSYIDENGYECVRLLDQNATAEYAITMSDITDRKRIKITEAPADRIYPSMYVKYQKDFATGERQKIIRFKNTDAATFSESYVEAPAGVFSGAEAEYYWGLCKALWNKSRQTNEPPTDLTEPDFLNGVNADNAAKAYITKMIEWMGAAEIELPVHYEKANNWKEGTVFTVNFAHQTAGATITCILEDIEVDTTAPYECRLKALLFISGVALEYNIQNVMGAFGTDSDWQNTYSPQAAADTYQNV